MIMGDILQNVEKMRSVFNSGRTKSIEWRKRQLEAIVRMIDEKEDEMCDAMKKDLNKVLSEKKFTYFHEILFDLCFDETNVLSLHFWLLYIS